MSFLAVSSSFSLSLAFTFCPKKKKRKMLSPFLLKTLPFFFLLPISKCFTNSFHLLRQTLFLWVLRRGEPKTLSPFLFYFFSVMPLPWKKSKSGRISKFVSDIQQSPKHGGSLVVETGFPTSLIDLFFKNRDRLKKTSSKRTIKAQSQSVSHRYNPPSRQFSSLPPIPLQRPRSLPRRLDDLALVTDYPSVNKIDETIVGGLTNDNRHHGEDKAGGSGCNHGGGGCVLMVVVFKVFLVAVLALSTKKLAVGITISAFALLFLELVVGRVFTLLNLCPDAQVRLDSLIRKVIGSPRQEKPEESLDGRNKPTFEIIEESREEARVPQLENKKSDWEDSPSTLDKTKPEVEEKQVQTIRDVVFKTEKSKSSKLKSRIVNKIVPKKLRSYKKKKIKIKEKEGEGQEAVVEVVEEEGEGSVTEVSSLVSDDRIESEVSDRDDIGSNPPLLESCEDIEEEVGSKGNLKKAIVLIMIALVGLLNGKVIAICLTLSWCLILRVFCSKSQTSL